MITVENFLKTKCSKVEMQETDKQQLIFFQHTLYFFHVAETIKLFYIGLAINIYIFGGLDSM